jgi:predicted PurR-regulated permease PerM
MRIIWFALTALAVAALVALAAGAIWSIGKVLTLLSPVLWPLAIAAVVAYLLDPAVNWLEHHKISRTWGIVIVFIVALSIVGGVLGSVIPQMVKETNKLAKKIPPYTAQMRQYVNGWVERAENVAGAPISLESTNSVQTNSLTPIATVPATNSAAQSNPKNPSPGLGGSAINNKIAASATDWFGEICSRVGSWLLTQLAKATALFDVLIALVLIPVYAFYFLREKIWIRAHWTNYLPIRNATIKGEVIFIIESINQYMIAFFRGQVLVAICSGVLYTIGFLILGLDYAFLLGFCCLLLTIIPFLGPMISFVIAIALTAMQFADWFHPLMIFVIFMIVVSLENFFYSPQIMGHRVGLHPLVIIVAVMIGVTLLGGILGGVLAIPLAAALRVILFRYLWKRNGMAAR